MESKMLFWSSFVSSYAGKNETYINPVAVRKAKIVYNFGLCECNRVKKYIKSQGMQH